MPSFWQRFRRLVGQDLVWIRTACRCIMRATFATLLIVTSSALVLGFAGWWIIGVWAGNAAVPSSALLWSMCFWALLLSITVNQATLLAATQRLQFPPINASLTAVLNLALFIVLVRRFGAIGVLSATIISYCCALFFVRHGTCGEYFAVDTLKRRWNTLSPYQRCRRVGYELRTFAMRMRRIFGRLFTSPADVRGEQHV